MVDRFVELLAAQSEQNEKILTAAWTHGHDSSKCDELKATIRYIAMAIKALGDVAITSILSVNRRIPPGRWELLRSLFNPMTELIQAYTGRQHTASPVLGTSLASGTALNGDSTSRKSQLSFKPGTTASKARSMYDRTTTKGAAVDAAAHQSKGGHGNPPPHAFVLREVEENASVAERVPAKLSPPKAKKGKQQKSKGVTAR